MHSIVESMLDEVCEEMRDMKESKLGSWQNAVTVVDGTWQTRSWHSKNVTFIIRNYLNGAGLSSYRGSRHFAAVTFTCLRAHGLGEMN